MLLRTDCGRPPIRRYADQHMNARTRPNLLEYFTNKNVIGGGQPTLTGPSFVDETNINSVADLAEAGTR